MSENQRAAEVGKQKQKPTNEMKTDVKVKKAWRSIFFGLSTCKFSQVQMPAQHALDEKGEEVTHRRQGPSGARRKVARHWQGLEWSSCHGLSDSEFSGRGGWQL